MRIISGRHKGRVLHAPKGLPARPTTDYAKESLFNILGNHLNFADMEQALDLFAGTGNISFELASRGVQEVWAVEQHERSTAFIRRMAIELQMNIRPVRANVFAFLKKNPLPFELIFADPPYASEWMVDLPAIIMDSQCLAPGGWLIIEHDKNTTYAGTPGFTEQRKYGHVNFSFFRHC